ncbi:MAG TPA: tripartite tricarboxylate transporter TctB family protein [Thermodesulfobacteriota bacterium]|nr:tripartite tricarboxylate transporter TctB family protein [Thermodesulfobacteriota bacterium]
MRKGLIATCVFLLCLAGYGIIESSRLERTMQMGIGIAFFPLAMSLAIGILTVILLVGILKGRIKVKDKAIFEKGGLPRVAMVVAFLMGYLILIEWVGYVGSTFLFFFAMILIPGKAGVGKTLLTSVCFTLFLYAIFRVWLKSPLPTGFLGM